VEKQTFNHLLKRSQFFTIRRAASENHQKKEGFNERDLKVIILNNQRVEMWNSLASHQLEFQQIIKELGIDENKYYENLLIGKDGGVKLKSDAPISNEKLFETIDAMPMRQREMRNGN